MTTENKITVERIDQISDSIQDLEKQRLKAVEPLGNISPYSVGDRFIRDTRYYQKSSEWELISVDARITEYGLRWVGEIANVRKNGSMGQSRHFIEGKAGQPVSSYYAYQPKERG